MASNKIDLEDLLRRVEARLQEAQIQEPVAQVGPTEESPEEPAPKPEQPLSGPKQFLKDATQNLPTFGAVAGGTLGATASGAASMGLAAPAGGLAGAAMGGATGSVIRDILNKYVWDDYDKSTEQQLMAPVEGAVEGLTTEMGGRVIGKAVPPALSALRVAGKQLGEVATSLMGRVGQAAVSGSVGAGLGAAIGGKEGAQVGAGAGVALGLSGQGAKLIHLSNLLKNPAGIAAKRVSAKIAVGMEAQRKAVGKNLGRYYEYVDDALENAPNRLRSGGPAAEGPVYKTGKQLADKIEQDAIKENLKPSELHLLRREIKDTLTSRYANKELNTKALHQEAAKLDEAGKTFTTDTPQTSAAKLMKTRVARFLRNTIDDYIEATGDVALATKISEERRLYAKIADSVRKHKPVLKVVKDTKVIEEGKKAYATILSRGEDVLGKSAYRAVESALVGRSLSAAVVHFSHQLLRDPKLAALAASILDEEEEKQSGPRGPQPVSGLPGSVDISLPGGNKQ